MILIYTETLENAAIMAAALGGIHAAGKIIRTADLEKYRGAVYEEARTFSFIKSGINTLDAAFIWGDGFISIDSPKSLSKGAVFPEKLSYILPNEPHAKRFMDILSLPDHRLIYDASINSSILPYAFDMLRLSKEILKVNITDLSEEGIRASFKAPLDSSKSKLLLYENITSNYVSYYEKQALTALEIPLSKEEISLLKALEKREDEAGKAQGLFEVYVTAKGLTFKSKQAVFSTKEEAESFIESLPKKALPAIKSGKASYFPEGPHSTSSLIKAANVRFHYPAHKTSLVLGNLYEKGFVTSKSSEVRTISKDQETAAKSAIKMLKECPNFMSEKVRNALTDELMPRYINSSRECAILPSKKRPGREMTEAERNIYALISEELLKCFLGENEVIRKTFVLNLNGISFSAHVRKTSKAGFSILEDEKQDDIDLAEEPLSISAYINALSSPLVRPYTKAELLRECQVLEQDILSLIAQGYISKSKNSLILTPPAKELLKRLGRIPYINDALFSFENRARLIKDAASFDEAIEIKNELIKDVKKTFMSWLSSSGKKLTPLYICPICKNDLEEKDDRFSCSCGFTLGKQYFGYKMEEKEILSILKDHKTGVISNLKSENKSFSGVIYLGSNAEIKCLLIEEDEDDMI